MTAGQFDTVAFLYDPLARLVFGRALERAQTRLFPHLKTGASVLILGGGTGFLLNAVLTRLRPRYVLYLEASAQMLSRAAHRTDRHPLRCCVTFRQGTQAELAPGESFDVVLLPFVLDLYTDETLRSVLLPPLLTALAPGGQLLVTDFDQPRTAPQRLILWAMYRFFRLSTGIEARRLPDWPRLLTQAGLTETEPVQLRNGQLRTGIWKKVIR